MATRIDLHTHTVIASPDSELNPAHLVNTARKVGLHGAVITEHNRTWERRETDDRSLELGFPFIRGMEVTTELGHVLVYGLNTYVGGIHVARDLRKTVKAAGGFMVAAHPFRNLFHNPRWGGNGKPSIPSVQEAAQLPLFDLVDEIEVLNGGTGELENFFAWQVAQRLGMKGTGGSDAHSTHGLGLRVTVFEREVCDTETLIAELRAGRFFASNVATESGANELVPYGVTAITTDLEARLLAALDR